MVYLPLVVNCIVNLATTNGSISYTTLLGIHAVTILLYILVRRLWTKGNQVLPSNSKPSELLAGVEELLYELSREVIHPGSLMKVDRFLSETGATVPIEAQIQIEVRDKYRLALLNYIDDVYEDIQETGYLFLKAHGCFYVRKDFIGTLHTLQLLRQSIRWYHLEERLFLFRLEREVE